MCEDHTCITLSVAIAHTHRSIMQALRRPHASGARIHAPGSLTPVPALIASARRTWTAPKAQVPSSSFSSYASVKGIHGIHADGIVEKEVSRAPAWWSTVISASSKAVMLVGIAAVVVSGPSPPR